MDYKCELFDQIDQPVLSVRTRTPVGNLPQVLGQAYGQIMQYLGELGEMPCGAPYTAYYNMDMQDLDLEIGFPVSKHIPGKEPVQAGVMPAGKYAACLHKGPYDQVGAAYEALTKFIQENGLQPTGVAYEFYLNDPTEVAPDELKTQVVFPLVG